MILQCPKCGGTDLNKAGYVHDRNGKRGQRRYQHPDSSPCKWHGSAPITLSEPRLAAPKHVARAKAAKRLVITAVQNATDPWWPGWNTLLKYCEVNKATLLCVPYRYHNPTSIWNDKDKDGDWWHPEFEPYLFDLRTDLGPHLTLLGDIKTQPTATRPLAGFEAMTGGRSAIIAHPKLELLTVPTPQQDLAKVLVTTGAMTERNYIPSKAGKKGEFHHTFGAAVVELSDDGLFFLRQLNMTRTGTLCDLGYEYTQNGYKEARIDGLVMGDTHVEFADPLAVEALFGKGGIVPTLDPKALVWHDVLDFYSGTHHHDNDFFTRFAKHHAGRVNVEQEVRRAFAFINKYGEGRENIFAYSNHNDMLARWVKRIDPKADPENAVFWAKTFVAMCEGAKMHAGGAGTIDPFAYWGKQLMAAPAKFLNLDESYQINGIEVGMHGHIGPGGSKGLLQGFTKIGTKSVTGHSHSPGIMEGAYRVGTTSVIPLEFAHGPTSWLHAHCAIYKNGKRSLIISIGKRWRA
jgi:hypothetical protein